MKKFLNLAEMLVIVGDIPLRRKGEEESHIQGYFF
jgi:hypothetical protein